MEKIIYALWRRDGETRDALNLRLRKEIVPRLLARADVRGLRLNLQDEAVVRAEPLRQRGTDPQVDAIVQLWLDVSHGEFRAPVDAILREAAGRIAAWLVLESNPIPNTRHPAREGQRTEGWAQFCFLRRPARLSHDEWLHNWQGLHTRVGIDTQANFEYIQNLVVKPLIEGSPVCAAIVEECFPTDAMDDPAVFYDAVDDPARLEAHLNAMMESCARFIEMAEPVGGIDVLPTSQYDMRKIF